MTAFLQVEGVSKRYGEHRALDGVSFELAERECLALLGPSGCGKTTLLNIVAGFITPDGGNVAMSGQNLARVPAHRRDMAMVFQDYALFPHLSVAENVGFGLRMRKVGAVARRDKAERVLDLVGLAGFGERRIQQLSGGQRQRVAIARALAIEPRMLLFDEPLSNLDARLRDSMRIEIRRLLDRTGSTALFVTHDQAEAFAIADRIMLMNQGRIEQIGPADRLYERPVSRFAASFLGNCNLVPATVAGSEGAFLRVHAQSGAYRAAWAETSPPPQPGQAVTLAIRPHHLRLGAEGDPRDNSACGIVETVAYLGASTVIVLRHEGGGTFLLEAPGRAAPRSGDAVTFRWGAADTWTIPEASEGWIPEASLGAVADPAELATADAVS